MAERDEARLLARIEAGERIESPEEMTEAYRENLIHLMTMQAVAGLHALPRHAGADDLAEPVEIQRRAAPERLELRAHRLGPRLGAEEAVREAERAGVAPLLPQGLADVEGEGRRAGQALRAEVLE